MSIREVSGKIIWFCALLAGGVGECISSPFLAYSRDWWVQKEVSIKYSCLSYQYFWVNYATVKGAGGGAASDTFFSCYMTVKRHQRQSTFFTGSTPQFLPHVCFWRDVFQLGLAVSHPLGRRQHAPGWLGSSTLHPLPEPWPHRAAGLPWLSTVNIKMGSKPYRTGHCVNSRDSYPAVISAGSADLALRGSSSLTPLAGVIPFVCTRTSSE